MDSNREEELQARRDGAELVANSGRGMRKGDARLRFEGGTLLIDYKFTDANSYTINLKETNKFFKQAYQEGFQPALVPVFRSERGQALAVVPWELLKSLLDAAEELV